MGLPWGNQPAVARESHLEGGWRLDHAGCWAAEHRTASLSYGREAIPSVFSSLIARVAAY